MELRKEELLGIIGGGITGTIINAIVRGVNTFMELGRSIGSAIRRIQSNNICPL